MPIKMSFGRHDGGGVQGKTDDLPRNARHDRPARDEEQLRKVGAGTNYHEARIVRSAQ